MNNYDVKRLALVFAKQAEIEGMKAKNCRCCDDGEALAYSEYDFNNSANDLRNIAAMHDEQL